MFNQIYDGDFTANNANAPYDKFNLMMVAFGHVNDSGELDFEDGPNSGIAAERQRLATLKANTKALRDAGKLKLVMSLGWGIKFNDIPKIEMEPEEFAQSVKTFISENDLDGFDIDYETPRFSSEAKMSEVSIAIRNAIGPNKLFTITPNNAVNLVGSTLSSCYNYVNPQSYNAENDASFHVSQVTALGVPAAMIDAGADIENVNYYDNDKNRVAYAINQYKTKRLNGVFMWQLRPRTTRYPAGDPTVNDYANQMWSSTRTPQTALNKCVKDRRNTKAIPTRRTQRLMKPGCVTNAGQAVGVTVRTTRRGDVRATSLFCKVSKKRTTKTRSTGYRPGSRYCKRGSLKIRTYGLRLKVRVTWSAPDASPYSAYTRSRTYRT